MDVLALVADPTRRRIIELLADDALTAGEIASHFTIARPGVSRHLRQLREGGVVTATQDGRSRTYHLVPQPLAELDEWLAPLRSLWANRLDALDTEIRRGLSGAESGSESPPAESEDGPDIESTTERAAHG